MTSAWKITERARLLGLLGELPVMPAAPAVRLLAEEDRGAYVAERLELQLNGLEAVPAVFVRPKAGARDGRYPVVLFHHSHGGIHAVGKEELLADGGKGYLQRPSYAEFLTGLGYAALSFDAWGFGERSARTESEIFKSMLWEDRVLWGMMVYDSLRAADYLAGRGDVDASRIGTLGISMGGTMAWWHAALDERMRFCVSMCSLADYDALVDERALDRHGIYYYVPGLRKHFTSGRINALVSPRPHLALAGARDELIPLAGLAAVDREAAAAYAADGAAGAWRFACGEAGHEETPEMRAAIEAFLLEMKA